jgi:flavin reductase (DIM6/NTAB) family NADH-FMN oxidoreductase RutF
LAGSLLQLVLLHMVSDSTDGSADVFNCHGLPGPAQCLLCQLIKAPRVRESAVQLECKLKQIVEFKDR